MKPKPDGDQPKPEDQLRRLIERLDPKIQKLARSVRTAIRKRFPAANELAYDYTSFIVIAYSPTERGTDSVVSFAARPTGVFLYFMRGPELPDPKRLLKGSAKQVRFIQLESSRQLAHPDVEALIVAAMGKARVRMPTQRKGALIIKTFGNKKRPARKKAS